MTALAEISREIQVVFPVHPRTRQRIASLDLALPADNLLLTEPLGYLDFLALEAHASLVLTDSGGVQEETTYLGVPCLTARPNTERPITVAEGTNELVASRRTDIVTTCCTSISASAAQRTDLGARRPQFWDGQAAERIVAELREGIG